MKKKMKKKMKKRMKIKKKVKTFFIMKFFLAIAVLKMERIKYII